MIKYKTTDREQRENNAIVLGFSYCSIQNIERFLNPSAYTCGVYGWRAGLERIEKRLNKGGYKWQKNGSFHYCREQLQKILKRLEKRANKEAEKESLKYRK